MSMDDTLERALHIAKGRKLYTEYKPLYDHSRPFGLDNIGVYNWAQDFHNAGATEYERALISANRIGKTRTAGAEVACHLTGWYPAWWEGRRWNRPVSIWTGCETNEASKDIVQAALLGEGGDYGTGWIPRELIEKYSFRQAGVPEVVAEIRVKHMSGGISTCGLKTYDQGRRKWQGTSKDVVWLDEESPLDVFTEALTRILDSDGLLIQTFTPMLGMTEVFKHFTGVGGEESVLH